MILGISPAVGNGLHHMAQNGYLERFAHQCKAYGERFDNTRFFSYVNASIEKSYLFAIPESVDVIGVDGEGDGIWHALLRPLKARGRYFRDLSVIRCISLLGAIPAIGARLRYGVPFVVSIGADYRAIAHLHGRRQDLKWRVLEALAANLAHTVLTPSLQFATALRARHRWARVVYLPNWVDTARFCPAGRTRVPGYGRTVLYVGRLVEEKNLIALSAACRRQSATLVCIGEGPLKEQLIRRGDVVHGAVPWASLPQFHAQADAFAMVSHTEGHCKALAEAMASGLPCIVSPAVKEGIRPGDNALQTNGYGPDHISQAIKVVLGDKAIAVRLGKEARRTAANCWGPELLTTETQILVNAAKR